MIMSSRRVDEEDVQGAFRHARLHKTLCGCMRRIEGGESGGNDEGHVRPPWLMVFSLESGNLRAMRLTRARTGLHQQIPASRHHDRRQVVQGAIHEDGTQHLMARYFR